ncbi:MAG: hypothetical protein IIA85_00945 [Nanoarchaeota archaeon]|nr:hypothetical protein [Nanoarchaeota archaeon]
MKSEKKLVVLTGFLFLTVFMLGITSAVDLCWIETSASTCTATAGNQVVMYVSSLTNAHGELESFSPHQYSQVLCCNFGSGDTTCSADNKIIGLSSPTNAHAERPENSNYTSNVCYDNLTNCFSVSGTANCAGAPSELEVLRLSSSTNAHLEGPGLTNYDTKICCVVSPLIPPEPNNPRAFWSDDNFVEITFLNVVPSSTSVKLVLENSGFAENTTLDFSILEREFGPDTSIRTVVGTTDNNGKVVATWIITSEDLATATDFEEFYFVVDGKESGSLTISVLPDDYCLDKFTCGDYTQDICESDVCDGVAENSVPEGVDCSDPNTNCYCTQNEDTCSGAFSYSSTTTTTLTSGDGIISPGETCDGSNWGPITGCTDFDAFTGGILSCDSTGHFDTSSCTGGVLGVYGDGTINLGETCDGSNWGGITGCSDFGAFTGGVLVCESPGNFNTFQCTVEESTKEIGTCLITEGDVDENGCDDGFLVIEWTGQWIWNEEENPGHLDPKGLASLCTTGGTRVIECPAQIKLPFFGFYNIIATIFLITIIYFILIRKSKKED